MHRSWLRSLFLATVLAAGLCQANDRPFQIARTAVLEDDEAVWSFESWLEQRGPVRGLSVEPEYTFDGGTSLQMQLSRYLDRHGDESGNEVEIEFKHIFNNIERDGWGIAFSAALGHEHSNEAGSVRTLGIKLPLSIQLGEGGALLHLNPGLSLASGERRVWTAAMAIEQPIYRRSFAFAEVAQEGSLRFGQIGVRHWVRKERLAIDFAWQEQRGPLGRTAGPILGIGWYDL
jgi:hypothetical protein